MRFTIFLLFLILVSMVGASMSHMTDHEVTLAFHRTNNDIQLAIKDLGKEAQQAVSGLTASLNRKLAPLRRSEKVQQQAGNLSDERP